MLWNFPTRRLMDPWMEFSRMRNDMERLFGRGYGASRYTEFPAVNVWSDDNKVVLTAELPGVDADQLDISLKENTVTIRGSRSSDTLQENESYLRQERGTGSFVRSFALPFKVKAEQVEARYQRGILEITLPKTEDEKPKQISVSAA